MTFEQSILGNKVEVGKIVATKLKSMVNQMTSLLHNLVTWADVIRKTFKDGGVDEIISTRRLVHIV